ncbi:MAG: HAMP domain-containing histidine kinase [Myxococcales bacterium]|nr:HAMP domain-containing histidine kinase [Myxococcales bacterium]
MPFRWLPRLSRAAVVLAIGVVGAALVAIVWITHASVVDARATMLRGLAADAGGAVRTRMMESEHEPAATRARDAFEATTAQHVRYLALIEDGRIVAAAGTPSDSPEALVAWFAAAPAAVPVVTGARIRVVYKRPPPRANRPTPPGRGPGEVLLEIDPAEVDHLDTVATWSLAIGVAAALTLIGLALVLVRWSLGREASVRTVEQARHLANLGQMSAILAHEIRNPLASLKGNAQLLARALPEGERTRAKADRVVDEAVRLEHLTNDLLAFARSGEIRVAAADPVALLREAADAAAPGRVDLHDDDAPRAWPLDADRMRQVLVNLLENAAEMSDGRIDATVTRGASGLRFVVRDHGPGLPDGDLARVFEPFFTRRTHGTGLGLAVCKRLVELHGGTLAATNPDGGGAAFTIDLPKAVR